MKPVARVGDKIICGNPKHAPSTIVSGGQSLADGRPVARIGDSCGCGAVIVEGSSQSDDNGMGIAYLGAAVQCGPYRGQIVSASPTAKVKP
ncbi:hypothetical protein TRM7557_01752 [Tritonibacter multivorans]|uniref:Uncharacterized protein n=1 Tax=Tritonibacter multivorans TaxID=928856 RepID=A0A0N7LZN6_9RHOB|nr:PAAR domain-containing protein [Tritonibacter multivorans]MDA7423013.1 PAAR domain-containing protein [Tritonibacter multivorans]CUH78169.1 hypothetical protein TRM7557_01752 [Tritonibacter multivorans]SFD76836.1 Zn-binding Pro-Ala-Ala-Arg (PAAR) domain-containing protein, incolved in TypeVI secretion [Tritonibacter multivorans]